MAVDIALGCVQVNWHPKSLNRLLRFFRYFKPESLVIKQEKEKLLSDKRKEIIIQDRENEPWRRRSSLKVENCETNPVKFMTVKVKLLMLNITLIHPINHTYPISTMKLGLFEMDYVQSFDHDEFKGSIADIRMFDNTNYPLTIDPNKVYATSHTYPNHEILGPRIDGGHHFEKILLFECIMFTKPLENDCPH